MIKIAICDDDIKKGEWIDSEVSNCLQRRGIVYQKQLFSKSKALWYEIEEGADFEYPLEDEIII